MKIYNNQYKDSFFNTKWLGKEFKYFDIIGSTSDYIKEMALEGGKEGLLVVADKQDNGRGSKGRKWSSPAGTGIWMSFLLKPEFEILRATEISILISYCIAKILHERYNVDAGIKWPNDIILKGKKVTGILVELTGKENKINYIAAGIGMNVNTESFPEEIKGIASSLYLETGNKFVREKIINNILQEFEIIYEQYLNEGSLKFICNKYNDYLVHKNQMICIHKGSQVTEALSGGINKYGQLYVTLSDGTKSYITAGELSVRGVQGYI